MIELKTTGIRENRTSGEIEAKEPASITAVSIASIWREDFFNSAFWHKAQSILFIFYHYDSISTVKALDYKNFYIRGHLFYHLQEQEHFEVVKNDWQLIHDFIANIKTNFPPEDAEKQYPLLSTYLNRELVYLDTAPKYPHPPRIRFRKRLMTIIVQQKFGTHLDPLPDRYLGYEDVYYKCHKITDQFGGMTFRELCAYFSIDIEGKTPRS
ncbi:MAG: MutH/Sau3AI family endonuclease [Clostridia bacterium]|nr:MutH/Sau3AI family endonuclease [Clostridia bacterium]